MRKVHLVLLAVAVVVPAVGFSAGSLVKLSSFLSKVDKIAIEFPKEDPKVKGLCICQDSSDPTHYGQVGRLLHEAVTIGNTTRVRAACQWLDFDATTGELQLGADCAPWQPLTK